MSRRVSIDSIVGKTLDGIVKAHKDYHSWTGGYWLWHAPEYLMTTYIAQHISKLKSSNYLWLEYSAKICN